VLQGVAVFFSAIRSAHILFNRAIISVHFSPFKPFSVSKCVTALCLLRLLAAAFHPLLFCSSVSFFLM